MTAFALHPTGRLQPGSAEQRANQAPARELLNAGLLTVVAGTLGVGIFFGTTLTSLTGFLAATGDGDRAGLLYGAMGIGSAALALGSAALPQRFTQRARWLVFGSLLLAAAIGYGTARSETGLLVALAVLGFGVGPTLVALYSLAATLSPTGRSATTMTMLGSAIIVGQAVASAVTGALVDRLGPGTALVLPAVAAALVVVAGLAHRSPAPQPVEPARELVAAWREVSSQDRIGTCAQPAGPVTGKQYGLPTMPKSKSRRPQRRRADGGA